MGYKFSDLVNMDKLQGLFDSLYEVTGIVAGLANVDGIALTETSCSQLCQKYHIKNCQSKHKCIQATGRYSKLALKTIETTDKCTYYKCENGIAHAVSPIMIQGQISAFIYKPQFLLSPLDIEYFNNQARISGHPQKEYLEDVMELPVYTVEEMDRFMDLASCAVELMGEMGCCQIQLFEEQEKSEQRYQELMKKHQELVSTYEELALMEEELHNRKHKIEDQEWALKVSEDQIRYLAYHDPVTGLPNRASVTQRLAHWLSQPKSDNKKGAICFIDVDNFKVINDTFGHGFGDKVLKRLGVELERINSANGVDGMVGRFGGDEFVVAKFDIEDKSKIREFTNKIFEIFRYPWIIDGYEIFLTVSIGITVFPDDGREAEILLKNADIAMYEAKKYGKSSCEFFEPSMTERVVERLRMDRDLRNALVKEEFKIAYQPQINSRTGRVEAVEALIRWNHPNRGYITPDEFIPFAEDTGLIVPIGEWVLRTACRQNKEWQDKGYNPVRISVNISPLQLQRWNFINVIRRILEEIQLDPSYLELEITESNLMESIEENIPILERLRQMGVRIALDDFGTGYSSLNYLQRLPINNMKIDKTFVEDITVDRDKRYIAEVIIALAHRMNLHVTAEGVETEEQLRMLVNRNCDIIQGFLFSEPLYADQVERLLRRGRLNLKKFIG